MDKTLTRRQLVALAAILGGAKGCTTNTGFHLGCQTNAWRFDRRDLSSFLDVLQQVKSFFVEVDRFFNLLHSNVEIGKTAYKIQRRYCRR